MNNQHVQLPVATFADSQHPCFATSRALVRRHAYLGCHVASILGADGTDNSERLCCILPMKYWRVSRQYFDSSEGFTMF
jgi:hypothetical protein